jgi:hypothetical protein
MSTDNAKVLHDYILSLELDSATQTELLSRLQPIIFLEQLAYRTSLPVVVITLFNTRDYIDEFCRSVWDQKIGWDNTMGMLERLDPIIEIWHTEGWTALKPAKDITLEDIMSELGIN